MEIREFREGDGLGSPPMAGSPGSRETSAIEAKLGTALKRLPDAGLGRGRCWTADQRRDQDPAHDVAEARSNRRRLVLCGMNAKLTKAFSISGFDKDFTVVATEEALRRVLEPVRFARPEAGEGVSAKGRCQPGGLAPPPTTPRPRQPLSSGSLSDRSQTPAVPISAPSPDARPGHISIAGPP